MATTIQISDNTKQILESLKEKKNIKSYDLLLQNILKKHTKMPDSMFGSLKGMKWKKEDRANLDEL